MRRSRAFRVVLCLGLGAFVLYKPVAATIYTVPATITLLTALLGVGIVARAQRRYRRKDPETLTEGA
jgi:cytochrome c-type biogenesis protein CcmH/NrfF